MVASLIMSNPFEEDDNNKLPPPFVERETKSGNGEGRPSLGTPLEVGKDDKEPTFGKPLSRPGAGGMLIGPDDPIFQSPGPPSTGGGGPSFLPPYAHDLYSKMIIVL